MAGEQALLDGMEGEEPVGEPLLVEFGTHRFPNRRSVPFRGVDPAKLCRVILVSQIDSVDVDEAGRTQQARVAGGDSYGRWPESVSATPGGRIETQGRLDRQEGDPTAGS